MHIYTYTCRIHIDAIIKTSDTVLWKIYLSLYLKCLCVRGSWRPNINSSYWPQLLWPSSLCLSRSPGLLLGAWGTASHGAGFLYRILSLTHLISISLTSCLTELYNSSIAHSISLKWHVWLSSSGNNCHAVHRSLSSGASVYDCSMGFYLVPYCQPSPPTQFLPITAIGMCHLLPVHHFGIACLAWSKVNIQH